MKQIDSFDIGELTIQIYIKTSDFSQFPGVRIEVPDGFRILGGGAKTNWEGAGNLLTASFPQDRHTWIAQGKDHRRSDPETITAGSIGFGEK
jgi:hypothetical protein